MKWKDDFTDQNETSQSNEWPTKATEPSSTNYLDKFAYNNQSFQFGKLNSQPESKVHNSAQVNLIGREFEFQECIKVFCYFLFQNVKYGSNETQPGPRKFHFKLSNDKQKIALDPSQNPNKIDYYFNVKKKEQSSINKSEDQIAPKESR